MNDLASGRGSPASPAPGPLAPGLPAPGPLAPGLPAPGPLGPGPQRSGDADGAFDPRVDHRALFEASPNAYMIVDRALRFVAANAAYLRTVGAASAESLIGQRVFDRFPHDPHDPNNASKRRVHDSLQKVFATSVADSLAFVPYRVPRAPTDVDEPPLRFWSATHSPIIDSDGVVVQVLQHTVDVTELHEQHGDPIGQAQAGLLGRARGAEERGLLLDTQVRRLLAVFEQAPSFVAVLRGPQHEFTLANAAFRGLTGHRDVVGQTARAALPEVEGQGFFELLDEVYRTGVPFIGKAVPAKVQREPDGPLQDLFVDFIYQAVSEADGSVSGILIVGSDVTAVREREVENARLLQVAEDARVGAEAAAREIKVLAEAIPVQVWSATPDGLLDFVSARVIDYFGRSAADLLGTGWASGVHLDDAPVAIERWQSALSAGTTYETPFRLLRGDGAWRWHLARAVPFRDDNGVIIKWYGTNTDVDDAFRAREELEQRARFEQQLIGIVSHDLRNPLNAIGLSSAMLLRDGHLDARQGKAVARITSSTERATRLIRDLLDFSLARSGARLPVEPAPTDLKELVRHVVDEVHLAWAHREISVEHSGDDDADVDADRMSQVVGNLLANALQHSPADARVQVRSGVEGDEAFVAVHNDGPPIAESDRKRLFLPFQRGEGATGAAARSVGLGLHIAERLVDAHGGTVSVMSTAEAGTTFTVRVPRRHPRPRG